MWRMSSEKKSLCPVRLQDISHLRLRYPLGTWDTRVSRRFGRIRKLPLLPASRPQGQDPPSLGWTYYGSLGPASDEPADLEFCNTVKYLGIHLDSRLNWHDHVHKTATKCTNILFASRKMIGDRWGLSPDKIIWVFNMIIKPIMTYACVTWAPRILDNKSQMTRRKVRILATFLVSFAGAHVFP